MAFTSSTTNYATVIYDLHKKLKKAQNDQEKIKIYSEFYQNYFMSKQLWNQKFELSHSLEGFKEAVYHFHYDKRIRFTGFMLKLVNYSHYFFFQEFNWLHTKNELCMKMSEKKLSFPHSKLQRNLMWHEEWSSSPVSNIIIKRVEEMEKLYWKIRSVEDNLEKWIEYLQEANDHDFVKQNIEHQIGNNLNNKKLWKIYLEYLRENDPKEMLQVYSKYCRLFLEDFEMKNEYKNATEKYGPVFVPWKNAFNFEKTIPWRTKFPKYKQPYIPYYKCKNRQKFPPVNLETSPQPWSLPTTLIQYFIDKARPLIYSKFQKTCKYFVVKKPQKLFCYKFYFDFWEDLPMVQFIEESILFNAECKPVSLKPFEGKKLVITNSFRLSGHEENMSLTNIINNYIYECDVKYIFIYHQIITENDFIFLVGRGNVESLVFDCSHVIDTKGDSLILETILQKLPNLRAFFISVYPENIDSLQTSNCLSELKFNNKIHEFYIHGINHLLDPIDLCHFVKKNAAPSADFVIRFHDDFNLLLTKPFRKAVKTMLEQWEPKDKKCNVRIWPKL